MNKLPSDILRLIYEYDPTYHIIYKNLQLEFLEDYKYLESILNLVYSCSNEPFFRSNLIKKEFYFFIVFDKILNSFLDENKGKVNYKIIKKLYESS